MLEINYRQIDDLLKLESHQSSNFAEKYDAIRGKNAIQGVLRAVFAIFKRHNADLPVTTYELYADDAQSPTNRILRFAQAITNEDYISSGYTYQIKVWHCDEIALSPEKAQVLDGILEEIPSLSTGRTIISFFPHPENVSTYLLQSYKQANLEHFWNIERPIVPQLDYEELTRIENLIHRLVESSEAFSGNKHKHYLAYHRAANIYYGDEEFSCELEADAWRELSSRFKTSLKNYQWERWRYILDYFPSASFGDASVSEILRQWAALRFNFEIPCAYWQSRLHEVSAMRHLAEFIFTKSEDILAREYPESLLNWLLQDEIETALSLGIQQHEQRFFVNEFESALEILKQIKSA